MKSVILLTVIFFLNLGFIHAQSPLELEVVKQLNIYRKKHRLGSVVYDAEISKVALYHANYIKQCASLGHFVHMDKMPHDEQFDLKDFKELNFEQRAEMFPDKNIYGEITIPLMDARKNESIESIAKNIILSFDGSPKHKEIMLSEDASPKFIDLVGVSVIKSVKDKDSKLEEYIVNIDFGVKEKSLKY